MGMQPLHGHAAAAFMQGMQPMHPHAPHAMGGGMPMPMHHMPMQYGNVHPSMQHYAEAQQGSAYVYGNAQPVAPPPIAPPLEEGAATGGHTKQKKFVRMAAGERWEDKTLQDWPENDFRIFVGDLGGETTDTMLADCFKKCVRQKGCGGGAAEGGEGKGREREGRERRESEGRARGERGEREKEESGMGNMGRELCVVFVEER